MKTLVKKFKRKNEELIKPVFLFFLFIQLVATNAWAQDVSNVKNSLQAIKKEQEKIAFEEKMTYVYMALGLLLVMGVAWISTSYFAKKSQKAADEARLQRPVIKNTPNSQGKKYGNNKPRR